LRARGGTRSDAKESSRYAPLLFCNAVKKFAVVARQTVWRENTQRFTLSRDNGFFGNATTTSHQASCTLVMGRIIIHQLTLGFVARRVTSFYIFFEGAWPPTVRPGSRTCHGDCDHPEVRIDLSLAEAAATSGLAVVSVSEQTPCSVHDM
jgi:hypothetical protein